MLHRLFANATEAHAHCDLYCGVYDPAQAKIEALSCLKTLKKYHDSDDDHFKTRAIIIKEQRAEEVKHHLMVLWADFFTKDHFEKFPNLHQLFWDGVHGAGDVKKSTDVAVAEKLLKTIDEISDIFWQTDKAKEMGVYPPPDRRSQPRERRRTAGGLCVRRWSVQNDQGENAQQHERDDARREDKRSSGRGCRHVRRGVPFRRRHGRPRTHRM